MFPSPNRRLVNFAHSGFVKDWSKDNEAELPYSLCRVCSKVAPRKGRPARWPAESIIPCGKSPDFQSLTLHIKLSMNPVYQLMPSRQQPPRIAAEGSEGSC
jgi:hypothetical protein